uniref:phospholipid phosphatase-related protein type 3-like isoform X1 n=1 Tax=Styela clava TaxID=7725 RepID=UPI00193A06BB|nr:phospholipid phosphatase-related protein type 3-like isoform X1 [Styela clava]
MDSQEDTPRRKARRERPLLLPCFYFIEIPIFGIAAVLAYLLHFTSVFTTYAVTFSPTDVTLKRPFTPAENRSISNIAVFICTSTVPCALIAIVESILLILSICCKSNGGPPIGSTGCYISASLRRVVRFIGVYFFGFLLTSTLCDILRKKTSLLAPNFLSVCEISKVGSGSGKRIGTAILHDAPENSSNPDPLYDRVRYYSDDCLPLEHPNEVADARLQLPSYFVCLTTYAAVFTFLYFRLIAAKAGPVTTSIVTWVAVAVAYTLGLVEIAENRSHVTSVMAAWTLGTIVAYLVSHEIFSLKSASECICNITCCKKKENKVIEEPNNVFEDPATPKFSLRKYDVANEEDENNLVTVSNRDDDNDNIRPVSQMSSHLAMTAHSPATVSKYSKSTTEQPPRIEETPPISLPKANSAERSVIKELQNYMTETDFRGGLESPRPTQIRELSRGGVAAAGGINRKQVFSTFQAYPDIEIRNEIVKVPNSQNIPEDLHAAGSVAETSGFGLPANFQKSASCEIRPFSYHAQSSPASSNGSIVAGKLYPPTVSEGRPLSYSYLPRSKRNSLNENSGVPRNNMTTPNSFHPDDPALQRPVYFMSDDNSDTFSSGSSDTSPLVSRELPLLPSDDTDEKDVINETSNLLREVFDVMNDRHDGESSEKGSEIEDRDSDETIVGSNEDQPSIVV